MPIANQTRACLEICVDTPDGLAAATAGGADRIELCANLSAGGLTPAPGLIAAAREAPIPTYAMIRPRQGDFVFSSADLRAMLGDIAAVKQAGLAGVVLGASRPNRSLDAAMLATLCEAAQGLGLTLHRAFDLVPDLNEALDIAIGLRFERILTSGGAVDASSGADRLRELVAKAQGRIAIMAGSGITPENVTALMRHTAVKEVHASAKKEQPQDPDLVRWGFITPPTFLTSGSTVAALQQAIRQAMTRQS